MSKIQVFQGWGVDIGLAPVNNEKIAAFLLKHSEAVKERAGDRAEEILARCQGDDIPDFENEYGDLACDADEMESFYSLIAGVMHEETGVEFVYHSGWEDDNTCAFMLKEAMPWEWSHQNHKPLYNAYSLEAIMRPYMEELGFPTGIEFVQVAYF